MTMTTELMKQMADEFCRWPVPDRAWEKMPRAGGALLTHAEALAMFTEIVGPKIAALELAADDAHLSCIAAQEERELLRAELARLRAAFEKPCAFVVTYEQRVEWYADAIPVPVGTKLYLKPIGGI